MTGKSYNKQKNKPYPSYKDSGIEWLGKIPEHWKLKKVWMLFKIGRGRVISNEEIQNNRGNYPVYSSQTENNGVLGRIDTYDFEGDYITWTTDGAYAGTVFKRSGKFNCTNVCGTLKPYCKSTNLGYFSYSIAQSTFAFIRYDINPKLMNNVMAGISVQVPTISEQKSIADFLDKTTLQIDSLIQKKEQQIELLKEKRSALITQAVTKGLNPNVKMKDSGIEYLGKIPEYWEIKKLRYVGQCQNGISKKAEYFGTGFPFLGYSEVYNFLSLPLTVGALIESTEQEKKYYSVMEGDVFFTRTSETIEDIGLTSTCLKTIENAVFSGFLIRFRPKKFLFKGFSKYYFRSNLHRRFFVKEMNLVTRASLSQELLKKLPILLPPLQDQKEIANFLDKETSQIDSLMKKLKKSIELLKEYRSALITSAVTGQIDVRESQSEAVSIVQFQRQQKEASPLFKKTVLGAEIVAQLKDTPHFGRTKFMKTLYLCEAHLQIPLKGKYKREAAGPLDNSIYKMEGIMKRNKWFEVVKVGSMYKYKSLKNPDGHKPYFDKYWGDYTKELNQLLFLVKKFTTEQSEIVDTIYAVWNDFLLEGKKPSDNEIICEVKNNWHKRKKRFSDNQLQRATDWMRKQNLIPKGYGSKTKTNRDIK